MIFLLTTYLIAGIIVQFFSLGNPDDKQINTYMDEIYRLGTFRFIFHYAAVSFLVILVWPYFLLISIITFIHNS